MKRVLFSSFSAVVAEYFYLSRCVGPGQVSEVGVHGHTHHLTVNIMEFISLVTECDDFRRADKSTAKKKQKKINE